MELRVEALFEKSQSEKPDGVLLPITVTSST
jgi:hypothetical protein